MRALIKDRLSPRSLHELRSMPSALLAMMVPWGNATFTYNVIARRLCDEAILNSVRTADTALSDLLHQQINEVQGHAVRVAFRAVR